MVRSPTLLDSNGFWPPIESFGLDCFWPIPLTPPHQTFFYCAAPRTTEEELTAIDHLTFYFLLSCFSFSLYLSLSSSLSRSSSDERKRFFKSWSYPSLCWAYWQKELERQLSRPILAYKPFAFLFLSHPPLPPSSALLFPFWTCSDSPMECAGLRARSIKLLHCVSLYPVNFICNQNSNLKPSLFFRIPEYCVMQFDRSRSRSGSLSPDNLHASGGVVIFVRQSLLFF